MLCETGLLALGGNWGVDVVIDQLCWCWCVVCRAGCFDFGQHSELWQGAAEQNPSTRVSKMTAQQKSRLFSGRCLPPCPHTLLSPVRARTMMGSSVGRMQAGKPLCCGRNPPAVFVRLFFPFLFAWLVLTSAQIFLCASSKRVCFLGGDLPFLINYSGWGNEVMPGVPCPPVPWTIDQSGTLSLQLLLVAAGGCVLLERWALQRKALQQVPKTERGFDAHPSPAPWVLLSICSALSRDAFTEWALLTNKLGCQSTGKTCELARSAYRHNPCLQGFQVVSEHITILCFSRKCILKYGLLDIIEWLLASDVFLNRGNFWTVFREFVNYLFSICARPVTYSWILQSCGRRFGLPEAGRDAAGPSSHLKKPKV